MALIHRIYTGNLRDVDYAIYTMLAALYWVTSSKAIAYVFGVMAFIILLHHMFRAFNVNNGCHVISLSTIAVLWAASLFLVTMAACPMLFRSSILLIVHLL